MSPSAAAADRRFFGIAAVVVALVVFAGFARTYYLKPIFGTPALSGLVHVHGVVMTLWFALLIVQVRLVATHRTDLHRKLGVAGALLALAVVLVGVATAITAARLGHTPGPPPLAFLIVPLTDMLVFTLLVGTGLALRRRPAAHKRLMLLGGVGMLTAAIARLPLLPLLPGDIIVTAISLTVLGVVVCVAVDTWRQRRLHPALLAGGLLIVVSWPLRLALSGTPTWQRVAGWLIG
ncbi:MAG TPA: hypothetical protein VLI72_15570 [Methylibium sp.]|nr:hypothetical protein [Methylibium sp.]